MITSGQYNFLSFHELKRTLASKQIEVRRVMNPSTGMMGLQVKPLEGRWEHHGVWARHNTEALEFGKAMASIRAEKKEAQEMFDRAMPLGEDNGDDDVRGTVQEA